MVGPPRPGVFGGQSLYQIARPVPLAYFSASVSHLGLYLLDEPETALSPRSQLELLELLQAMSAAGTRNSSLQRIRPSCSPAPARGSAVLTTFPSNRCATRRPTITASIGTSWRPGPPKAGMFSLSTESGTDQADDSLRDTSASRRGD